MMSASTYISASSATLTKFNGFDTTDYNSGSISFASGSTATVPTSGVYLVTSEMGFDSTTTGFNEMYIYKNGSTIYGRTRIPISSGSITYLTTSAQMRLIANDTIEIYVNQNSGGSLHIGSLGGSTARVEISKLF